MVFYQQFGESSDNRYEAVDYSPTLSSQPEQQQDIDALYAKQQEAVQGIFDQEKQYEADNILKQSADEGLISPEEEDRRSNSFIEQQLVSPDHFLSLSAEGGSISSISPTGIERKESSMGATLEQAIADGNESLALYSPGKSEPYLRVSIADAKTRIDTPGGLATYIKEHFQAANYEQSKL